MRSYSHSRSHKRRHLVSTIIPSLLLLVLLVHPLQGGIAAAFTGNSIRSSNYKKRTLSSLRESTTASSEDDIASNNVKFQTDDGIFLRFSPLVGNPRFLPLHAEIILFTNETPSREITETDASQTNNDQDAVTTSMHRFDFLPKDPTSLETTVRLLTFRSVPGIVRNRTTSFVSDTDGGVSNCLKFDKLFGGLGILPLTETTRWIRSNDAGIVCRIASMVKTDTLKSSSDGLIENNAAVILVQSAVDFCQDCREGETSRELNLISNNCFTFAIRLLNHLGVSIGG